jgi:hypothetical protein
MRRSDFLLFLPQDTNTSTNLTAVIWDKHRLVENKYSQELLNVIIDNIIGHLFRHFTGTRKYKIWYRKLLNDSKTFLKTVIPFCCLCYKKDKTVYDQTQLNSIYYI